MTALALAKLAWDVLTSRVGLPLVVVAGMFIYYEGLPIGPLRYVPFIGQYLAAVTDGRVDRVRASARLDMENEARARAMALIQLRSEDNAEITDLDSARLCAELGGRWVPNEDRCD